MKQKYTVLIVDDHPLITDAYKNALLDFSSNNGSLEFEIYIVDNCELADEKISEAFEEKTIDIFFLDIKLPPSKDRKILSGEDLGIKINQFLPNSKIIISTMFNDTNRIRSIFRSVNPDGFLIKNDITSKELILAIQCVINDTPYYSKTVINLLRNQFSHDLLIDEIDRQLLYELSIGTKMKNLPDIIPLSIAGIEKRKRRLKEIFDVDKSDDRDLIFNAKEKGFI